MTNIQGLKFRRFGWENDEEEDDPDPRFAVRPQHGGNIGDSQPSCIFRPAMEEDMDWNRNYKAMDLLHFPDCPWAITASASPEALSGFCISTADSSFTVGYGMDEPRTFFVDGPSEKVVKVVILRDEQNEDSEDAYSRIRSIEVCLIPIRLTAFWARGCCDVIMFRTTSPLGGFIYTH